jgi:class 3 adenylate cyclase
MILAGAGLVGFGVQALQASKNTKDLVKTFIDTHDVIFAAGEERYLTAVVLARGNYSDEALGRLDEAWAYTDKTMNKFYAEYPSFQYTYPKKLLEFRQRVIDHNISAYETTNYYEAYVQELKSGIGVLAKVNSAENLAKILIAIEHVERVFVMYTLGEYMFGKKYSRYDQDHFASFNKMNGIIGQQEILSAMFRSSATQESIELDDSYNSTSFNNIKRLTGIIGSQYMQGRLTIDATQYLEEWQNVCEAWKIERYSVGDMTMDAIVRDAENKVVTATYILVYSILVLSLCFIFGTICALIMARTITGPWRRLSKYLQDTIRKFVPDGFMKLVRTRNITDMELGKYVERDITMLLVEIKNLKTSGVSGATLLLLNDFLSVICPIVRKHGGFVDRYTGDGFTALFRNSKQAMIASVEILEAVTEFNQQSNGDLSVGVTAHSAFALIATVGENERMDYIILSKESSVNQRLQNISDKLDAPIVVTRQALSSRVSHRYLGCITHKELPIEVFEVFDSDDTIKQGSIDVFNRASFEFDKRRYYKAKTLYDQVYLLNQDNVAKVMASICQTVIDRCELELHRMRARDILQIVPLRNALEDHCKKEFSTENFDLWNRIQTFRAMNDPTEMRRFAKFLYDKYCDIHGQFAVNITDVTRFAVKRKLDDVNYVVQKDLFDKLNLEIITNLEDTAARFKETDLCRELYLAEMNIEALL